MGWGGVVWVVVVGDEQFKLESHFNHLFCVNVVISLNKCPSLTLSVQLGKSQPIDSQVHSTAESLLVWTGASCGLPYLTLNIPRL